MHDSAITKKSHRSRQAFLWEKIPQDGFSNKADLLRPSSVA